MLRQIVTFIKKNKYLCFVGYKTKELRVRIAMLLFSFKRVDPRKVLFATFNGRFNDNCLPVAKMLHDIDGSIQIIWGYRDKKYISEFPDYIKPVKYNSLAYFLEMCTSSSWVYNFAVPQGTIKRKNQFYIQLWHGDRGMKRIANDASKSNKHYSDSTFGRKICEKELCDLVYAGSKAFVDVWTRSTGYCGKYKIVGTPRCDCLIDNSVDAQAIRKSLNIRDDVSVLLYAPTFRDHCSREKVTSDIDLQQVLEILKEKYNREWICLKRSHGGSSLSTMKESSSDRIIDMSTYRDICDLLIISDMLITDYSSSAGDFALTNKPVILYQDDINEYLDKDRSFIWDPKSMPYFVAYNMNELKDLIMGLTDEKIIGNSKKILDFYQTNETGKATLDVVNEIIQHQKCITGIKCS